MIPFTSRIAVVVLLAAAALAAQQPVDPNELLERARTAPAEFAADALLRLADSGRVDKQKRREAIEEAFQLAAGAQQPLKKRAIPSVGGSGMAGFLGRSFAQNLDATSLRCRAVRAMLPIDGALALRMFREMPPPAPAPLTCDDPLVYDVSAYYETLAEVAGKAFTPAEIEEEEPFKLLAGYVRGISAPAQVAPVARMLATVSLKPAQLEALAAGFAGMLKEITGDDRSFSQSISSQGGAGPAIAALAARCRKMEIPTAPLVEAYRAYLVRHFRAARCADSAETAAVSFGVALPESQHSGDPVRYFNEDLREDPVRPLDAGDLVPDKVAGAASGARPCDSQDCRRLAELYRGLLFGPNGMPYGPETMTTSEWQAQVREYLAALAAWKDDPDGSAASLFRYKCSFYNELAKTVPNAAGRALVLGEYLDFLKQNSFQQESRMEWLLPVNSLVARASLDPAGLEELWHELRASGDPVIALYAALEEIAPRPPDSRLSIF